jgi:predicted DsbA family dithiol-disulfide isomerase
MTTRLRIDFVSDIACPWCVIGLGGLKQALAALGDEIDAAVHFQPFELNPDMGADGENTGEHLARKYGSTPERSAAARTQIAESGAAFGFRFNFSPDSRLWNTFDAHRLIAWAATQGKQYALKEALFAANFTDQANVSDHAVLIQAARNVGLDGDEARAVLESDAFAQEIRQLEDVWRRNGINAVPTMIVDRHWIIQGAQPADVLAQALREIAAKKAA